MKRTPTHLTPAQQKFLAGYLPDILHGDNADLAIVPCDTFVRRVSGMDFDDGETASNGTQRIARNLERAGFVSNLDIHPDAVGGWHIYLTFTGTGAQALFEISRKSEV